MIKPINAIVEGSANKRASCSIIFNVKTDELHIM